MEIPPAVIAELSGPGTPDMVRQWIIQRSPWLEARAPRAHARALAVVRSGGRPATQPPVGSAGDPLVRQTSLQVIEQLSRRGSSNLARIHQVTTSDPELRVLRNDLIRAQTKQSDRLDALRCYLGTEDLTDLTAANGALAARAATSQAVGDFQRHQFEYLAKHHLLAGRSPSEP